MSKYTETLGTHKWTPAMENAEMCGSCPVCKGDGYYDNEISGEGPTVCVPDFAGDGERLSLWMKCEDCGASWTDYYRLCEREINPDPIDTDDEKVEAQMQALAEVEARGALPDGRTTIWIDGVEQELYSVEDALEIMADIHAVTVALESQEVV